MFVIKTPYDHICFSYITEDWGLSGVIIRFVHVIWTTRKKIRVVQRKEFNHWWPNLYRIWKFSLLAWLSNNRESYQHHFSMLHCSEWGSTCETVLKDSISPFSNLFFVLKHNLTLTIALPNPKSDCFLRAWPNYIFCHFIWRTCWL